MTKKNSHKIIFAKVRKETFLQTYLDKKILADLFITSMVALANARA
jgi:hypothetical protein